MNYRKLLSSVATASTLLFANPLSAAIEEIIVTAQHREQNIQDVPLSVTALNSDFIERADIHDSNSISVNVPGFTFAEFAPGQALLSFRGINSADDGAGLDNSIASFLDGVYIGRLAGVNFDLFDLDRIEVLKGPQGTLFGRNAIGGVINIVTQKPSQEFAAKVGVTVGNEGIFRYQGYVTGQIADGLSGKFVVNHRQHDGFVRNVLLGIDVDDEDQTSFRGQLRWETDNMDWVLSLDTMDDQRADPGRFPIDDGAPVLALAASLNSGLSNPFTNASPVEGFTDRQISGGGLQGDIDFSRGTLTTITGVRRVDSSWELPSIGVPLIGGFDLDAGNFGTDVIDDIEEEINTFSQELRWTSNLDGRFSYVAGLYYFIEDTDRQEQFRLDNNSVQDGQVVIGNEWTRTENETTSYAVYGQADYQISEKWNLTLGARWTRDERDYIASAANCNNTDAEIQAAGLDLSVCTFNGLFNDANGNNRVPGSLNIISETFIAPASVEFNDFSPKGSIQYRPNDSIMYFATVSTGYKSGGFAGSQGVAAAATAVVDPEEAINYEFGFKGDFWNDTLRLNATGFFVDYTDLQVVRFGPVPNSAFGSFQTTNIGSADISGFEVDFIWQVSDELSVSGNYAYLNTETNDLVLQTFEGEADFSGLPLRQAPERTWAVNFDYIQPVSYGDIDFRFSVNHVDENHFDFPTFTQTIAMEHTLLDARLGWTSLNEKWNVAIWGKNLTNEAFSAHAFRIGPGSIAVWNDPQTYGITGTWEY